MPTVSVIIPTYNRANLLPRAIKSVLNQTFQDFELIIVDDASTDNTEEVVKSFHDQRIIYIKHERNKDVCASRNTGIKKSQGQYIAFLDHDDEYLPYHIERKINILQKIDRSYGFIYSDCFVKSSKGTVYFSIEEAQKRNGIINFYENYKSIGGTNIVVRREYIINKDTFFDTSLGPLEDWDFLIRISKFCRGYYLREPLYNYYVTEGSITNFPEKYLIAGKKFYEKYLSEFIGNLTGTLSYLYYMSSFWAKHWYPKNNFNKNKELVEAILFWKNLYYTYKRKINNRETHIGFQLLLAHFYDAINKPQKAVKHWFKVNLLKPFTKEYTVPLIRALLRTIKSTFFF